LSKRAPLPYEYKDIEGGARIGNIEYEFVETQTPTIEQGRAEKTSRLTAEYKRVYGVEYTGEPLTEKTTVSPPIRDSRGKLIRKESTDQIRLSKEQQREERRLATRIETSIAKDKYIAEHYRQSNIEKKLWLWTGQTYEPLNTQPFEGVARTGKTPAELKWKRPEVRTVKDILTGARMVQPENLQTGLLGAPEIESPEQTAARVAREGKEQGKITKGLKYRSQEKFEIQKGRRTTAEGIPIDPIKYLEEFRGEFNKELDLEPTEVKKALEWYHGRIGNTDPLQMLAMPQVISSLKGLATKQPKKASEYRGLMQKQLNGRLDAIGNVEVLRNRIDSTLKVYDDALAMFDLADNAADKQAVGHELSVVANDVRRIMELVRNQRYSLEDKGIEGVAIDHAKKWVQTFDSSADAFKEKLGEEKFGIKEGRIVDLKKPEGTGAVSTGPGEPLKPVSVQEVVAPKEQKERDTMFSQMSAKELAEWRDQIMARRTPKGLKSPIDSEDLKSINTELDAREKDTISAMTTEDLTEWKDRIELKRGKDGKLTNPIDINDLDLINEELQGRLPKVSELQRLPETGGIGGMPGEHRFLKKPGPEGPVEQREEMKRMKKIAAMVNGRRVILPGASSKEIEKELAKGAKLSREAQEDPTMRNKMKEAEFRQQSKQRREAPPIKVPTEDKDRVAKKIILQPMTQSEVLVAIKAMEDAKKSPFYLTEEERIKLYNRNPVRTNKLIRFAMETAGQFSQSSVPEKRLLAQGADKERMAKANVLRQLIYDDNSPMKRIRRLASQIQGVKSEDEGLELTASMAMRRGSAGLQITDPAMKEIIRIARDELAPGFAKASHMVDVGINLTDYDFPLVVDMNQTYQKIKGRYIQYEWNALDKIKGGETIQAMTTPKEWEEIRSIFKNKDYWKQNYKTPFDASRILTPREQDSMRRSVLQWTSALDEMRYMPGEKRAQLRLKDSFNGHLRARTKAEESPLSYKQNFADAWEDYIYNMTQVNYINNIKKLAAPLINVYGDRDIPWTPGWEMERYVKRLFGSWDPIEKWIARQTETLNDTVGRQIINPAFAAKGLVAEIQKRTIQGALGFDSAIRQITDHTKMMVMDEAYGKTYMKTWVESFWNVAKYKHILGPYYQYWDAMGVGREAFEGITGNRPGLGERLSKTESWPKKLYTFYDWIGEKALSPFTFMEHFNKGFAMLFNINRMKAKGANWDEAVQVGIHNATSNVANQYVPKPIYDAYLEMINQNIGYSKEHRSIALGLNPLTRISTIFWSYPGDMARYVYQGTKDGWYMGRHGDGWGQFARFCGYIGFQASIAGVLGSTLGIDVGSTFGVGLLPVKTLSVPWEIMYNSFKGIDPLQYVGKPQYQEDERQKALEGVKNAMGILFVPQYRWTKQQINNLTSLDKGFKQQINGRDIMEWNVYDALKTFLAMPPIENRETFDLTQELSTLTKKQAAQKRTLVKDGVQALRNKDYNALFNIRTKAQEKGIPLSFSDLHESMRDIDELTTLEKAYKQLPANLKPQYKARIEELKSQAFPGGEIARQMRKQQRGLWSQMTEGEEE